MEYTGGGEQNSLRGKVFKQLLDDILNGKYKPGETLVESRLADELGVSRTPIREALKQLELEGLVTPLANRRVVVEGVTQRDIDDIYVIRKAIEGIAARWATEHISESQLEELRHIVDLEEFFTQKGDMDKVEELDREFHNMIFQASNSKPLRFILSNFHQFVKKARRDSLMVKGRMNKTLEEHRAILKALEDKDPDEAEKAMIRHISGAEENYTAHRHN
ncbi:MAG: transcriptional regulator, GntR family [Clostridiales bacterium]|jgi:DNA-binding GntR family transcriptional regulator|nr:transcriptional regulator, GntR family [Clostridiales bacterium]